MNYTYQSFNFRNRQGARPFYDLVASIAAEEFGHIELVVGHDQHDADRRRRGRARQVRTRSKGVKGTRNTQHFIAGGAAALVQDSMGKPWTATTSSRRGDLVEDLTHNFFLETGARNNKLKVYEMVEHPAARALTGYLLVRGGVHQVAYARALENLTGANLMKLFPSPQIPTDKIPECRPHIKRGEHLRLYRFSPDDFLELGAVFNGPHPETGEQLVIAERPIPRAFPRTICPPSAPSSHPVPTPRRSPRWQRGCASRPACRRSPRERSPARTGEHPGSPARRSRVPVPSGRRPPSSRQSRPAPRREPAARAEWLWSRDDSRAARACGLRRRGLDRAGDDRAPSAAPAQGRVGARALGFRGAAGRRRRAAQRRQRDRGARRW